MRGQRRRTSASVTALAAGSLFGWSVFAPTASGHLQAPPPPPQPQPLSGITNTERSQFQSGALAFGRAARPEEGLGPVFNGVSCVECHRAAGPGGAATNLGVARVTRIGGLKNGMYADLTEVGGPVLQARSLQEFVRGYPVPGEVVPREASLVSKRLTTPVFGSGLIEAIPDSAILALEQLPRPDGVHGVANRVSNPETGKTEIGRFGWKAQISTLHWFAGDAYLNEMGLTSRSFPKENLPQGKAIPRGADPVPDPEETRGDVEASTAFMRFLAPPVPQPPTPGAVRGEAIFDQMRCTGCHVASLQTGPNPSKALANVNVRLYSDLLLHRMGAGLSDGIVQGKAGGDQWRTPPLWGISRRPFLLHDGRATSIDQAIRLHGGEATVSRDRYFQLSARDRGQVIEFLSGL